MSAVTLLQKAPQIVPFPEATSRPKLLDQVRDAIRSRHCSRRTEQAYVDWIRRYIVFHHKKHPSTMGAPEIARFLSWLATARRVSESTQNQALSAVLFLYRHVLHIEMQAIEQVPRAKMPERVPVVLSREEVGTILKNIEGAMWIVVALLYGAGLRLQECLELRVKDIDFDQHQIVVRRGKGQKDRLTMLPVALETRLGAHLRDVKRRHEQDLANGFGRVVLPCALDRKYPNAATDWDGSLRFPRHGSVAIRSSARRPGITCTSRLCSGRWPNRHERLASRNVSARTPCGTRSRRTCSPMVTTFEPSRNCSVTRTSRRRWCTPTF
jgi:integron integrase